MAKFTHLHLHTQYSILDGASKINEIIEKAKADDMEAVAITDHGNMFGVKDFWNQAKANNIKPIIGIETYVAANGRQVMEKGKENRGYHLILLAKNATGYKNLMKLSSIAFTEGFYYNARIDHELLEKYHEGIIASSACLGGEIAQHILKDQVDVAYERAKWFKNLFGDDFYLELMRHPAKALRQREEIYARQEQVNKELIKMAKELDIKLIATNDVHFTNAEDAEAHDRLICLVTNTPVNDPKRMRYTKEEYFKTTAEMQELFSDVPEAVTNTQEIVDKVELMELDSKPIMPYFPLPDGFETEDDYLRHLTYEGAKKRWGEELEESIVERIDFELETIKNMGFPGYFLVVWDFIAAAREMGVIVGPGRGSAAGSAVAFSLKITSIDPIKYDLLFERFLNPDRISMPDIDIDFDDDGRQEILEWVVDKYGADKVAHIITFGTMATKSSIRDVARVQEFPLKRADEIAKLVPEAPKMSFKKAYKESSELRQISKEGSAEERAVLQYAEKLEGSVRQTGVHACGIIISKESLTEYVPVCKAKEAKLLVTQYDGRFVESIGMLKMDFLGLKTLSIIKDCLEYIHDSKGFTPDIEHVALDDAKTFELYSRGETTALFQFESPGMKKHLRNLKPDRFEDLVAMNALYRPGPMAYIPDFIDRKHGRKKIEYDHPLMKEYLEETYGITVFQEQVMLLSRKLANFTRGQSDSLRKAMGKKLKSIMAELKVKFREGALANPKFTEGCKQESKDPEKLIEKIWKDWEAFAEYAFNKSHSVCYAYVSYQTAYLKAHFPSHFMAAVLSRNLSDISKVTIFLDETKHMGINVLGPNVNESIYKFNVTPQGDVRFGLGAVKTVGSNVVSHIIEVRKEQGKFADIYDFVEKIDMHIVNKKNMEGLAYSGAFDCFGVERHSFFDTNETGQTFIEQIIKYGNRVKEESASAQQSLFGADVEGFEVAKPAVPSGIPWNKMARMSKEKEYVGIFLSEHPLDDFKVELNHLCNTKLNEIDQDLSSFENKEVIVGGMVSEVKHLTTKTGKPWGRLTIEDFSGLYSFAFFGKEYMNFKPYMEKDWYLLIKGKVQYREWGNTDELEFKVKEISNLVDAREEKIKSMRIKIPINALTQELVTEMYDLMNQKNGKVALNFIVHDPEKDMLVPLFSRKINVEVSNDLVNYLERFPDLEYTFN
ncbi:MAG: DNA polymerase III subunit alpha [Salinivirgaceae bacterium]|jgi:DNA polymerase-3 subunit alpha|nr:DNA polymerase III subunit alpha [Salinivirgaceae bacterium]